MAGIAAILPHSTIGCKSRSCAHQIYRPNWLMAATHKAFFRSIAGNHFLIGTLPQALCWTLFQTGQLMLIDGA